LAVFKGRDPKIIISTSIPLCEGEEHAMCYWNKHAVLLICYTTHFFALLWPINTGSYT
jgi:hypothetical protein